MLFLVMMEVFIKMMKRVERASLLRGFRADGRRGVDSTCSDAYSLFLGSDRFKG